VTGNYVDSRICAETQFFNLSIFCVAFNGCQCVGKIVHEFLENSLEAKERFLLSFPYVNHSDVCMFVDSLIS
jgi:hypothetical protein